MKIHKNHKRELPTETRLRFYHVNIGLEITHWCSDVANGLRRTRGRNREYPDRRILSFAQILNFSPWHIFEIRKWDDSKNLFLRLPKIELGTYWSDDPSWSGQIIQFALDNRPHRPSSLHVPVRTSTHLKDAFTLATPLIRLIRNSFGYFCILRVVTQSDAHEFTQVVNEVVNIVIYGSSLGLKLRVAQTLF